MRKERAKQTREKVFVSIDLSIRRKLKIWIQFVCTQKSDATHSCKQFILYQMVSWFMNREKPKMLSEFAKFRSNILYEYEKRIDFSFRPYLIKLHSAEIINVLSYNLTCKSETRAIQRSREIASNFVCQCDVGCTSTILTNTNATLSSGSDWHKVYGFLFCLFYGKLITHSHIVLFADSITIWHSAK